MPKFLIIFLSAVLTLNAQANSFLFASGVNNTKIPPTAIIQNTCATHSGGGGAVSSAGTCDHYGSELIFYNDEINSISGLNISTDYQPSNNINTDYPDLPQSVTMSRDGETIYQFTNCEQTGRSGPSQSQATSAYSGTNLDGEVFIFDQGIQEWTIPTTGEYIIEASGAKGGSRGNGSSGGKGATMIGTFNLQSGSILKLVIGQMGSTGSTSSSGGGGGGASYVWLDNGEQLLIAASGGGGGWDDPNLSTMQGQIVANGGDGHPGGSGGSDGNGGQTGTSNWCEGGGGAGWNSDGQASRCVGNTYKGAGKSRYDFIGGEWVYSGYGGIGGFGGGGGTCHGGGGGGGYSGGGGGKNSQGEGGGGGSYNSGSNQINSVNNTGHGLVNITASEQSNTAPTASAQSVTGNEDATQTITLTGTDPDGDALTYALATNPSNGTWTLSGNVVTYTPNTN
jgi:hypothetical protein